MHETRTTRILPLDARTVTAFVVVLALLPCGTAAQEVVPTSGPEEPVASRTDRHDRHVSLRLRVGYANFSGDAALLPPGSTGTSNNLNGDGPGADIRYASSLVDFGVTFTSILWLTRSTSYLSAVFVGKGLRLGRWRLAFDVGVGGVSFVDASTGRDIRRLRLAVMFAGGADVYVAERLFIGLQIQSWVALGPEDDLGNAVGSIGIGLNLL